jgi:hypothetical protein
MNLKFSVILALVLSILALPAFARNFGDPVPSTEAGKISIQGEYFSMDRDYKFDFGTIGPFKISGTGAANFSGIGAEVGYGLGNGGLIQGQLASTNLGGVSGSAGQSGTDFGVNYRQAFGDKKDVSGKPVTLGFLAGFQTGSSSNLSWTEFQVAVGGSMVATPELNVYAAGIYDSWAGKFKAGSVGTGTATIDSNSNIGVYAGAEYRQKDSKLSFGGEYHLLFESGIALYARYRL